MLLTMQAAVREVNSSPEHSAAAICARLSHGALLGARGNSGVILSQIIRGFSRSIEKKDTMNASDFAAALVEGSKTAYKGVVKPVEGTILTVCREAADATVVAASQSDDLRIVVAKTVEAARASLVRTPLLLQVLKEAGVVDAGGQGLLFILEGALRSLKGETLEVSVADQGAQGLPQLANEAGWGFDIQFHIRGANLDVERIRENVAGMGESALVVGDPSLVKVHVHAPLPGRILDYGCSLGVITNVIVENMQEQYYDFMAGRSAEHPETKEQTAAMTTVAVAQGNGLTRVFSSLGVGAMVSGGQTMNPSTEDLLRAIDSVKTGQVIVLPNNKNIIPAAEQAKSLSKKQVFIIPTKSIPQGIAALLAFNYQGDLETNIKAMTRAAQNIRTAEITTATRSVSIDGIQVRQGQVIGLIDGALKGAGDDQTEMVLRILKEMRAEDSEIITVYYGESVTEAEAGAIGERIRTAFPSQEVEIVNGGQMHYHHIISVE